MFINTNLGSTVGKTPHDLRATWETISENEGGFDFTTLQRILNHSPSSQTAEYGNAKKITKAPAETAQAVADLIMERIKL